MISITRKRRKMFVAVAVMITCWTIWLLSASTRGELRARYDVAHGHYEIQSYGLPVRWRPNFATLLHQRYGVELHEVAGCVVSESLVSYVTAYNEVSRAAAIRRFGRDIFAQCAADAQKQWQEQQQSSDDEP